MRISDWSSDVCSSDLTWIARQSKQDDLRTAPRADAPARADAAARRRYTRHPGRHPRHSREENPLLQGCRVPLALDARSEEHTSELQSLMRISYAVFCLKKKNITSSSNIYSYRQLRSSVLTLATDT